MKRRSLLVGILCAIALLAGCVTNPATRLNGSLTPPDGMAYAIVSLTAHSADPDNTNLVASYRGLDNGINESIHAALGVDTIFSLKLGGPMAAGKLALLTLPPGHYEFYQATGYYPDSMGHLIGMRIASFPMKHGFELAAGEAVYLGEIRMSLDNLPDLTLNNEQTRDLGHVARIWKIGDISQVKTRLLQ